MDTIDFDPQRIDVRSLTAADGTRLVAHVHPADQALKGRIVVAGATGVPQGFYARFARFAQQRGFEVHTLDYRGVGLSAPLDLRGYRMDYLDWGRYDMAAAVDAIPDDGVPLYLVGHSYGGHALGLMPNHARIQRAAVFGTGAGWAGWMAPAERMRVWLLWNLIGPAIVRWKGYFAWGLLNMGENLPLAVFHQWRHWCRYPNYFFDDPAMADVHAGFASVEVPIDAVNAADDAWAPPASRNAFMRGYRRAPWVATDIEASEMGLREIGHMGYFRRGAEPLWALTLDGFQQA